MLCRCCIRNQQQKEVNKNGSSLFNIFFSWGISLFPQTAGVRKLIRYTKLYYAPLKANKSSNIGRLNYWIEIVLQRVSKLFTSKSLISSSWCLQEMRKISFFPTDGCRRMQLCWRNFVFCSSVLMVMLIWLPTSEHTLLQNINKPNTQGKTAVSQLERRWHSALEWLCSMILADGRWDKHIIV